MWPEAEKTHELLDLVRDGDDLATGRLLERHRDALHRMAEMRLDPKIRQRIDASDIIQEVMIEQTDASKRIWKTPSCRSIFGYGK